MKTRGAHQRISMDQLSDLIAAVVAEGDVYRMRLDKREEIVGKDHADDPRNKYFVVIGRDEEGTAFGFFVIDTEINPNLPPARKERHFKLCASDYEFLEGKDRYVDCSDIKCITKERFTEMFDAGKEKGHISDAHLTLIKEEALKYENAPKKMLKRFGLIK